VSRKTSKGIPRYPNHINSKNEDDIYILSGAEDLVPVAETNGVTQYRPRTEGLFARIERYKTPETDHWKVSSKDGLVSFYGTPSSIAEDPAVMPTRKWAETFSWNRRDKRSFGNIIQYSTKGPEDQGPSLGSALSETHSVCRLHRN
jgi:hypothetical protein